MKTETNIRVLTGEDVEKLLTPRDVLDAVEKTFLAMGEGKIFHPLKEVMWLNQQKSNMLLAMPAHLKDRGIAGVKWVYSHREQQPGYPTTGGILLLSRAENGQTYAMIEATGITTMRTAGGHSVIAAKYLAKKDSRTIAFIGCGQQAVAGVRGFLEQFPGLKTLNVYDAYPPALERMERLFGARLEVVRCARPRDAVEGADIVVCASTSKEPLVYAGWLPKGCFVAGVSSFFDLDTDLSRKADKWVLGCADSDRRQIVDNPIFEGGLSMENVYCDLGEVVSGRRPGRENDEEIILFSHMGVGSLDIAVGQIAYERAVEQNVGKLLSL